MPDVDCAYFEAAATPHEKHYCARHGWMLPRSGSLCIACRTPGALRIVGNAGGGSRPKPHARTTCKYWLGERPDIFHKGPCCVPQSCQFVIDQTGHPDGAMPKKSCGPGLCKQYERRTDDL